METAQGWFSLESVSASWSRVLAGARDLPAAIRRRATEARDDALERRARLLAQLEERVSKTAASVMQLLHLASREEVVHLDAKIGRLEQRLEELNKGRAA